MILDFHQLEDAARQLSNLTWLFGLNKTHQLFYTSDNPIGRKAHVRHPHISMTGLNSKGVEFFFPLSPDLILIMFDGDYHWQLKNFERKIIEIYTTEEIDYYNSLCATQCSRCVFSADGDFSLINDLLSTNPNILDHPHVIASWNGQEFIPPKR